jgi:hypothetical protein
MATKKEFINGKPAPVTPESNDQKVQDHTPDQNILSKDQDYDENEHSDDIAALKKEPIPDRE